MSLIRAFCLFLAICLSVASARGEAGLLGWQGHVKVAPVLGDQECHSIHTYFVTSPESPDGRRVLLYRSTARDGHRGEICVVDRASGVLKVLVENIEVEDAHRAACQQWVAGGKAVAFHDLREGQWVVAVVDIESGRERVLAVGRQLGFGQADGDELPLYGPHWQPGEHRDLELVHLETGRIRTPVTAAQLKGKYAGWIARQFGERPVSIFFPVLSPDSKRVFFKVATPAGGGFRSAGGKDSDRYGLVCYDLEAREFLFLDPRWGHPAWHPASRSILNVRGSRPVLMDGQTGKFVKHPDMPPFPGAHPSLSPDGRLFVTDARGLPPNPSPGVWSVVVGNLQTAEHREVHRFNITQGARSWRPSHPHPAFSPDGRRIYFNVSDGRWTKLYVAERGEESER